MKANALKKKIADGTDGTDVLACDDVAFEFDGSKWLQFSGGEDG